MGKERREEIPMGTKESNLSFMPLLKIGLVVFSGIATYFGLFNFMVKDGSVFGPFTPEHVISTLLAALLMLSIVAMLWLMFSDRHWAYRALFSFVYLILTGLSVSFGFGLYWFLFNSSDENSVQIDNQIAAFEKQIDGLDNQLQVIFDAYTYSSQGAEYLAKQEGEPGGGGTCPGSYRGGGCGTVCRMRKADAIETSKGRNNSNKIIRNLRQSIRDIKSKANELKTGLDVSKSDSKIEADYNVANDFFQSKMKEINRDIRGIKNSPTTHWLNERIKWDEQKYVFPNNAGIHTEFKCIDDPTRRELITVASSINELIELDRQLLTLKAPTAKNSIKKAIKRLINSITYIFSKEQEKKDSGLKSADIAPLIVAAVIDFLILIISLPSMRKNETKDIVGVLNNFNVDVDELQDHAFPEGNKHYIVCCKKDSDSVGKAFGALLDKKEIKRLAAAKRNISLRENLARQFNQNRSESIPHEQLEIYQIKSSIYSQIVVKLKNIGEVPVAKIYPQIPKSEDEPKKRDYQPTYRGDPPPF